MAAVKVLSLLAVFSVVSSQKVDVRFYGESLCPDCTAFTTKTLRALFSSRQSALADFRYIGWGNVQKQGDKFSCQHGPIECRMNTVLNCGQNISNNQDQFFSFLFCIESQAGSSTVEQQVPGCAKAANLGLGKLEKCYKGQLGRELDDLARRETNNLRPMHTYVPWVTVNGIPLYDQVDNLASYICVAYNGSRPEACYQPSKQGELQEGEKFTLA